MCAVSGEQVAAIGFRAPLLERQKWGWEGDVYHNPKYRSLVTHTMSTEALNMAAAVKTRAHTLRCVTSNAGTAHAIQRR